MKINSKTITITTDALNTMEATELKAKALSILLGSYNKYGRKIPYTEAKIVMNQFNKAIKDMQNLLELYKND